MEKSYFDGVAFEDMGIVVERIHDDLPEMRDGLEQLVGHHGSRPTSLTLAPREITLECRALRDGWSDFDALKDAMAPWLVTGDERSLALRNHPGQRYMAHYSSLTEGDRIGGTGIGGFELSFVASDPVRYGESMSRVASRSASFDVGGTHAADVRIEVRNARGDGGTFALSMNGVTVAVPLGGGSAHAVSLDLVSRTCRVDGGASGITLDSRWPVVTPGRWVAEVARGSGTATISWTQRYL